MIQVASPTSATVLTRHDFNLSNSHHIFAQKNITNEPLCVCCVVTGGQHQLSKHKCWKRVDRAAWKWDDNMVNAISDELLPCCNKRPHNCYPELHSLVVLGRLRSFWSHNMTPGLFFLEFQVSTTKR